MKNLVVKVIVILLVLAFFASCKKDADNSNFSLLIRNEWRIAKYELRVNSDPFVDDFPNWSACTQDDKYDFNTDYTYNYLEGPTKCNPAFPDLISTGTWAFSQLETKIVIDNTESLIEKLNHDTLIISGDYITNPDTNYYRYTFVH